MVYTFALGVYCTSWTFYGLVGTAATSGWSYLPILLGPFLLFTFGFPLVKKIASICRREHIHSIADFVTSRYGKRQSMAVVVTLMMVAVTVPYIALQLKAVTDTLLFSVSSVAISSQDLTMLVAGVMLLFSLIFGANRLDVATYHSGIMVAIAFESLVKVFALMAVAMFALGISEGFDLALKQNTHNQVFTEQAFTPSFVVLTLISAATIFCLPRMFQVTFVECLSDKHLKAARLGFSSYLFLIAVAVFIIAWVGNQTLFESKVSGDMFVLALPLGRGQTVLGILAFLGGFSAATAMIIVASLTLSQMLSNDVILPLLIRTKKLTNHSPDFSRSLIITRRTTTAAVITLAWLYQDSLAENVALTEIGLIAFALAVQLAPAILLGLFWRRANAMGVYAGLALGVTLWFVTLMIPLMCNAGFMESQILENGVLGLQILKPTEFLGLRYSDAYTRGVVISLAFNVSALYFVSSLNMTRLADRIQAKLFVASGVEKPSVHGQGLSIHKADLVSMLKQFLGEVGTSRVIEHDPKPNEAVVDEVLLDFSEKALSGVVGVASARALLNSLSGSDSLAVEDVVQIFEETTKTLQFNQDMLSASFESISSAIIVVNTELEVVAWNQRYDAMFAYPKGMLCIGRPVRDLFQYNAARGLLGEVDIDREVGNRLLRLQEGKAYRAIRKIGGVTIEVKGRALPNGGYVTTYDDISEFIQAQKELEAINLTLEHRVRHRTEEVEKINQSLRDEIELRSLTEKELIQAKAIAEKATANKTHFLAIASHDILQPLNAANLYANALLESSFQEPSSRENIRHLCGAINSAEEIISNLLEISRLDTGAFLAEKKAFPLDEVISSLVNEYRVQVQSGVDFRWRKTRLWAFSDPKYFRRILQNFLSNAVKYCQSGKILVGCRPRSGNVLVSVYDTGPGISEAHQQRVFDDFYRASTQAEGAGLGLGISLRFANLLSHPIEIHSKPGKGTVFSLAVPLARRVPQLQPQAELSPHKKSNIAGLKLFYVDDDKNNILAMNALVSKWGCELDSASDTESALKSALERAKGNAPDALLLDYHLDESSNGVELALKLRRFWRDTPICIVSAAPDNILNEKITENGFSFIRKPIKPGRLRALLESYVRA